ncbi:S-adenosyl-L-methionine-dependent methyltransferase [Dacryopinax primogenitus]|uniref:S-adenosyl-L-methionine-dependent methyltransferase n=1 Tax=Dacryopinax primogenitus (strain DJM 731) TaxID=1858805 RepID=M5FZP8_DACPD|nr:S-adenosyl-L-methionine-dependent methyltransferase [Dacryopinax primogenitus]EJU01984.1 S-adenosyl-L-methionine-dependent methyltransferase [Dacryopinax primogenitus]
MSGSGMASLQEVHGRMFNSQNSQYALPADQKEYDRLDQQHLMHKLALGSLYYPIDLVQAALEPVEGEQKAIMDLGTGSGIWAVEMAVAFPYAQVMGFDLAPHMNRPRPPNCYFEQGDFTQGMGRFAGQFDVVHARSVSQGMRNHVMYMHELALLLKPSGVLLMIDGHLSFTDQAYRNLNPVPEGNPGHSYVVNLLAKASVAMKGRGSQPDSAVMQKGWVEGCGLFQNIGSRVVYTPIGAWYSGQDPNSRRLNTIGATMGENLLSFMGAIRPLLIGYGFGEDQVDYEIGKAAEEVRSGTRRYYTQWHYLWATKRA